ncbi:sodium channel regulatory subunit beta-4 isoform 1-T1 [Sarcoramphus papa]
MVFQLDRDDLPRQDKEQSLGALPRGTQPTGRVRRLDDREGQQHLHCPEECGVQRCWEIHLPRQEPQGEERAAQCHHLPHGGPEDGGDRQHCDAHHRGRRGGAHRPPHPLHAHQEGCPVHHQEDPGWEEGVSRELVRERQHRERLGRLQGGTKSTTKGMKQRRPEPRPAQQRGGWAGGQAFPFCFLSKLPTLETCFYYTRACDLHCFSEKTSAAVGTGSFLRTRTGMLPGQREPPAPL